VCDEHINSGEVSQGSLDFGLFKQVVATRLVFPSASKATESNLANCVRLKVKVQDWSLKMAAAVMVALNCEDLTTTTFFRGIKDDVVWQIATRN